jgi:sulfur carrier protein
MPPMQTIDAVELVVNGEQVQVPPGTSVEGLLDQLKLDRRKVAVELNEAIVSRSTYADTMLRPGDRIEIVHFIGGG